MSKVIEVANAARVYGEGASAVHAVRDVSFTIEAGSLVAIVGSSGSGKSTLLNILGTLDRPSSGTVKIAGTVPLLPSATDTSLMVIAGAASSSVIVPWPVPSWIIEPTEALLRLTSKVSFASSMTSPSTGTLNVWLVLVAGKERRPVEVV